MDLRGIALVEKASQRFKSLGSNPGPSCVSREIMTSEFGNSILDLNQYTCSYFESRSVKTRDAAEDFHLLENFHKPFQGFHQAMKAR